MSEWFESEGRDEAEAILNAQRLAGLYFEHVAEEKEAAIQLPRTSEESRFLDSVRARVTKTRPSLGKGFRRQLSLTGKPVGGEIDFVGTRYVTCYAAINPRGKVAGRVQTAAAALWRLARARDAFGFASPSAIELTAWVPPEDMPLFTATEHRAARETVLELQAQARREALDVYTVSDIEGAAARLVNVETRGLVQ